MYPGSNGTDVNRMTNGSRPVTKQRALPNGTIPPAVPPKPPTVVVQPKNAKDMPQEQTEFENSAERSKTGLETGSGAEQALEPVAAGKPDSEQGVRTDEQPSTTNDTVKTNRCENQGLVSCNASFTANFTPN